MNNQYFRDYIFNAYESIGAFNYDFTCIYSDFRGLAQHIGAGRSKDELCSAVINPLLANNVTVIIPTFTYTTEGRFDISETPTKLGVLAKWFLAQKNYCRSEHPLFSFTALGPDADVIENIGKSAFGADSVCARLRKRNTSYLHVGRPINIGNTSVHHVEQMCGVSYRSNKAFRTKVYSGDRYIGTDYTACLRRDDVENRQFKFTFTEAEEAMRKTGLITTYGNRDKLTAIEIYNCNDTLAFLENMFYENPHIFLENPFLQY